MNSKQLQYVITLAREGSFSKAADALNITQPSLSQYIKKIEKEIEIELFDRTNSEVRITDAGRVFIDAGQKILEIERQMENTFSDIASHKTGSLIIGASPYRAASMMPETAALFKKHYPGMHLMIREGTTAELIENMRHGAYDLAVSLMPVDKREFDYRVIMEEELLLAVPASCPPIHSVALNRRKYPAVDVKVLDGKSMIMLTETQFMQKQLENMQLDYDLCIRPAGVVKSIEAQIEMVKAGVGMALVPSGIEYFCKNGDVAFYSFVPDLPMREVVIIWRKDRKLTKVMEDLIDVICSISW